MTTAELVDQFAGSLDTSIGRILVGEGEVRYAGTTAQREILTGIHCLQKTVQLALVAGQRYYYYPQQTVAAASIPGGLVTLTIPDHPFHTGDTVVVDGIVGLTGASGWFNCTKVDADRITLDGSAATGSYVSGGRVFHGMAAAHRITPSGFRKVSTAAGELAGTLTKRTLTYIETWDEEFPDLCSPDSVINFWEEYTKPLTLGVQGIPGVDILTRLTFYRIPLPSENLSSSVDPILTDDYDELLKQGTLYHIMKGRPEAIRLLNDVALLEKRYRNEFAMAQHGFNMRRETFSDDVTGLEW